MGCSAVKRGELPSVGSKSFNTWEVLLLVPRRSLLELCFDVLGTRAQGQGWCCAATRPSPQRPGRWRPGALGTPLLQGSTQALGVGGKPVNVLPQPCLYKHPENANAVQSPRV